MNDRKPVVKGDFIVLTDKVREDMNDKKDDIWPAMEFIRIAERIQKYSSYFCSTNYGYNDMTVDMGGIVISIEGSKKSFYQNMAKLKDSYKDDIAMIREARKLLDSLAWYQTNYKGPKVSDEEAFDEMVKNANDHNSDQS